MTDGTGVIGVDLAKDKADLSAAMDDITTLLGAAGFEQVACHSCTPAIILEWLMGKYEYGDGRVEQDPFYMIYSSRNCNYPHQIYAQWWLTQLRRWGFTKGAPDVVLTRCSHEFLGADHRAGAVVAASPAAIAAPIQKRFTPTPAYRYACS